MTTIAELIARVEALSGPDREVDLAIARALVPDVICTRLVRWPPPEREEDFTHWEYTASLDAVVALAERVLPGCWWEIEAEYIYRAGEIVKRGVGRIRKARDGYLYVSAAPTPALALLLALLRAVQAQKQETT